MYFVYILKSLVKKSYYIGHSSDIGNRLKQHNSGKVKSTKANKPWKVVYTEILETKSEAYKREMKIKSYKGGKAFKELIK